MATEARVAYSVISNRYFESLERYQPSPEYAEIVRPLLGPGWSLTARGFWSGCARAGLATVDHGWKIHISTSFEHAANTLARVVPILVREGIKFKFVSDSRMLLLSLNKNWAQSQAGKFVTCYPASTGHFQQLLHYLHDATSDLSAPRILSDRPFRSSKVVFYRYGAHNSRLRCDERGFLKHGFTSSAGDWVADERNPYFSLPPGIQDPVCDGPLPRKPAAGSLTLGDGRYQVKYPLKFTAVGGVYAARDFRNDCDVILREARPFLAPQRHGGDAQSLLEKEASILTRLAPYHCAPRFVDLFRQGEHLFLAQEHIDGDTLWGHAIGFYYRPAATPRSAFRELRDTILKIIRTLRHVHASGIVLRDMTKTNVMVTRQQEIRFIDFEFAFDSTATARPVYAYTAGYASPQQLANQAPTAADDCYSLGALVLDVIAFTVSGHALNPDGTLAGLERSIADLRLPPGLLPMVSGLLAADVADRWNLARAEEALLQMREPEDSSRLFAFPPVATPIVQDISSELRRTVAGALDFLDAAADYRRLDRLWPPPAAVFSTNGVSLQDGACGGAYLMLRARGSVPAPVLDWIARAAQNTPCPPGLMSGHAGVALLLLDAGDHAGAARALQRAQTMRALAFSVPGLYYGAAGWGLAHLHFWDRLRDDAHLASAREAADQLLRTARECDRGLSWDTAGKTVLGYSQGQSGIALFLLYLATVTQEARYLDAAKRAVAHDWSYRFEFEPNGRLAWFPLTNSPPHHPKSPHLSYGTAGMGAVLIRLHAATGDDQYLAQAKQCAASVTARVSNKLGVDSGIAGFGELQLDLHRFLGDAEYLNRAMYLAETLIVHRIKEPAGLAFAGEDLIRVSADYAKGTAGIAMFLHRLLHPATDRLLMLDHVFGASERPAGSRPQAALCA